LTTIEGANRRVIMNTGWQSADVPRRALWLVICLAGLLFLLPTFTTSLGVVLGVALPSLAMLAAVRPYDALLVVAALFPLAAALFAVAGGRVAGIPEPEVLTLTLVTGWAAGRMARPRPLCLSPALTWSVALLFAVVAASGFVHDAAARAQPLTDTLLAGRSVVAAFVERILTSDTLRAASLFGQGLLLLLIAGDACAGEPRRRELVLRVMVYGAAAAAFLNVWRLAERGIVDGSWQTFGRLLAHVRLNVHFADLNAAGSYFAMLLIIACGLAAMRRGLLFAPMVIAVALWMTGSRIALASALAGGVIAGLLALRGRGRRAVLPLLLALALAGGAGTALWKVYPRERNTIVSSAYAVRVLLATAGLRMARDEPVFGVGVGRFYALSNEYVGRELWRLRLTHENAHNNFIQVLAELGIPGLMLFVLVLFLVFREGWRQSLPLTPAVIGLTAGVATYLVTCLGGHPLLVPSAAYAFWICAGLLAMPAATPVTAVHPVVRYGAVVLLVGLAAALPWRASVIARSSAMEHVMVGLTKWHFDEQGTRYRFAGGRSTFFLPTSAGSVRIPLRNAFADRVTVEVRIFLDGREADRLLLAPDDQWRVKRLVMKKGERGTYSRVDLEVRLPGTEAPLPVLPSVGGVIMVGRPHIEGS